jgi:ActR/RegA family two-component response regulator
LSKILLVDDDPAVSAIVSKMLRAANHDVSVAYTGRESAARLAVEWFDVVVLDYRLPDVTGLDLIRELRARSVTVPCVVITGFGTVASAVEAMKLGAVDFLEKSLESVELLHAISRATGAASGAPSVSNSIDGLERWCHAVVVAVRATRDPRTLHGWSAEVGVAAETLRGWCRTVNLAPKRSLDLARILRAVIRANGELDRIPRFLNIADRRTRARFWSKAGLSASSSPVSALDVLETQQFIRDPTALQALELHLRVSTSK